MKIGVFTVLFSQRPFEEALDYIKTAGCEERRDWGRGISGTGHANATALLEDDAARQRFQDAVTPAGWRSARSPAMATRSTRGARSPRSTIATTAMRCSSPKLEVPTVITFSGCPAVGRGHGAELGDLPLAAELHRVARVAVERAGQTLLVGSGGLRQGPRRARRHRAAPGVHRLPHRFVQPAARDRRRDARRQLRSLAPLLAGDGPLVCVRALGDAIFHVHAKDTWRRQNIADGTSDTAVHRRDPTARGTSARLASAMARSSGAP